jgi:hypothetical protein
MVAVAVDRDGGGGGDNVDGGSGRNSGNSGNSEGNSRDNCKLGSRVDKWERTMRERCVVDGGTGTEVTAEDFLI